MKLTFDDAIVYIDDKSEEAQKILEGYDYALEDGRIVIKPERKHLNKADLILKCKEKRLTMNDVQEFILHHLIQ